MVDGHEIYHKSTMLNPSSVRGSLATISFLITLGLTACAPWNAQTRFVPDTSEVVPSLSASSYIESQRPNGHNYGCSFIEFDGKGGFLDYLQLKHAVTILEQRKAKSNVMLVIYCHGWNNNAQSGDVIRFLGFLQHLSDAEYLRNRVRVEGVYLSWRGSEYMPVVDDATKEADPTLNSDFKGNLVDEQWDNDAFTGLLTTPGKYGSYWSIKNRAEFHVSRIPIARAVFKLAFTVKKPDPSGGYRHNSVFVLGHSFGALVLEQAIGLGSVGLLTSNWDSDQKLERWPFDLIVFLNSAAPSLYAKQFQEFMEDDFSSSGQARVVSITSTGDWATGILHPLGNIGNAVAPDLQREYRPYGKGGPAVKAWQYYALTPGHNDLLISHEIEPLASPPPSNILDFDSAFEQNLKPGHNPPNTFYTWSSAEGPRAWHLQQLPDKTMPDGGTLKHYRSSYWIVTVPPDIIANHTDIWNTASMDMLAGIFGITQQLHSSAPAKIMPAGERQN